MRKLSFILVVILMATSYAASAEQASLSPTPATTRTVSGTRIGHYKNGAVPVDLSAVPIAAYVPSKTGYTVITGSGTSSGTFTIPNVPTGYYLLQLGSIFLGTSSTTVDADFRADHRSDIVQANSNTTLTFDLTNLNSWQSTDIFEMVCPHNASFADFPGTVGETAFTGTFPLGSYWYLSEAGEGDQYYASQLITQNVAGYPFTALGRYIAPAKFTEQQGSDTPINGKLKTIAQTNAFEANFNGADMAAQAQAANPNAILVETAIYLDVYPGSMAKGDVTATPDLMIYDAVLGSEPLITTNGDLGPVSYGNPFPPANWPLWVAYYDTAVTPYTAPGATNGIYLATYVWDTTPTLPTPTSPMAPLVGVVNKPLINGKNFFNDQSGVGSTPLLKWSAPSLGTATFYGVAIIQLSNSGGNTVATSIAHLYTQHTSARIPPGLLSTGLGYVFRVTPFYIPGLNFAKTPFMDGATYAYDQVISGMVQP